MMNEVDVQIQKLNNVEFLAKAKITPSERLGNEEASFNYKRGTEDLVKEYYGEENVKDIGGGVLEVNSGGQKLTLRPSTELDPTLQPDGTRRADALEAWKTTLGERRLKVVEQAYKLAESNRELKELGERDPATMKDEELARFEAILNKAEAN